MPWTATIADIKEILAATAQAANTAAAAAQMIAAVASAKLEALEKAFEHHEKLDQDRFTNLGGWMKSTFFTLVSAFGILAFYIATHR